MPNKKRYWTQVFLVTTLVSCGLGVVTGFGWAESALVERRTEDIANIQLESALRGFTNQTYLPYGHISPFAQPGAKILGTFCPIVQPGATVLVLEPYQLHRFAAPPFDYEAWKYEPAADGTAQGNKLRMEGVPGATSGSCALPIAHRSSHCTSMDATPTILLLLLLFTGLAVLLVRKKFEKLVT